MPRFLGHSLTAIVLLALACASAPRQEADLRPTTPEAVPGVVLICFDTLRADAVARGALPAFERFARGAVRFSDACSAAPWTPPSVATMFTGMLPTRHGLTGTSGVGRLVPAVRTIAEALSAAGWHTAASTGGGWICPDRGFHQGFGSFDESLERRGPSRAREWLDARPRDRPFFLYLHSLAAHDPYGDKGPMVRGGCPTPNPDPELADALAAALDTPDNDVAPGLYEEFMRVRLADPCGRMALERRLGPVRMQRLYDATPAWADGGYREVPDAGRGVEAFAREAYDRGLAHVDATLSEILAALEAASLPAGTVVIVTADHGESFGEAGALYHGQRVHDAVVRVPLLLRAPGRVPAGTTVSETCGLIDLFATICDLAGLPAPEHQDGRSLLPLADGSASGHPVVSEAERLEDPDGRDVRLLSVRHDDALWVLRYDAATGHALDEGIYDRVGDPNLSRPQRPDTSPRHGEAFCRALASARARLAERFGWPAAPSPCD